MGESYASDFFVVDRGRGRSKVVVLGGGINN